jgi:hypothetical protein
MKKTIFVMAIFIALSIFSFNEANPDDMSGLGRITPKHLYTEKLSQIIFPECFGALPPSNETCPDLSGLSRIVPYWDEAKG